MARWREGPPAGRDPDDLGGELATVLDTELARCFAPLRAHGCLVAVGGYGRRDLSLASDVDLVLLHDGSIAGEAVRAVLYPLWDAGLQVGHATGTPREVIGMARDHLDRCCALLTARPVTGRVALWHDLEGRLVRLLRRERAGLGDLLAAEQETVWEEEPFARQEFDLKVGRGGLRTLHRISWDRRRAELVGEPAAAPPVEVLAAAATLRRVRTALHAVAGRPLDRYVIDLRGPVARWLGRDPLAVAADVYGAARRLDAYAVAWWAGRRRAADPVAAAGRALRRRLGWRRVRGGRASDPATGRDGSPARESVAPVWSAADREAFVEELAAGPPGWERLLRRGYGGWFHDWLPELDHVWGRPQAAPFHEHPVGAHLGRTVVEMVRFTETETFGRELAAGVGSTETLLLAAFLHDVGKGRPGDHAVAGARIAAALLCRVGFVASAPAVTRAVRDHLLLPEVAFRRDLTDRAVVAQAAAAVEDRAMLDLLTALAVADGRATGDLSWSSWKEALLREVHTKVAAHLAGRPAGVARERFAAVVALVGRHAADGLAAHVLSMPAGYLDRYSADEVATHLRLATVVSGSGGVRLASRRDGPLDVLVVVAVDRSGLLATISGVLALHRISVVDARIATRADGVAIDTFRVVAEHGGHLDEERVGRLRRDLDGAVGGVLDVAARLAALGTGPTLRSVAGGDVRLRDEHGALVVEVRGVDRPRFLHDCAAALAAAGTEIRVAKIDTRRGRALDVFVLDGDLPPEGRDRLRRELLAVLG